MSLVAQFGEIEASLPDDWADARLALTVGDLVVCDRAAALLGPGNPGRSGDRLHVFVARRGTGLRADALRRLLARIDEEGIEGQLELVSAGRTEPAAPPTEQRETLAATWAAAVAGLPEDWSDLYVELELESTDHLELAALLMAPLNPARYGGAAGFRFRCARRFGYGASPGMAARCLERLDEARIGGRVQILRALSDTQPVGTQGPVWYVGGRSV